jgi:hypothetical protein
MFGTAAMVAAVAVLGWLSFAAGESAGVTKGEVAAETISAAMAAGPDAASAWAMLMANNDPVQALTKRSINRSRGRPPALWPISRTSSMTREERRAKGEATPGRRSVNIFRTQAGLRHRHRLERSLIITGTP